MRFKKYLYVLRPLLAVRWLDQGRGRPPMPFEDLLVTLDDPALLAEIDELLQLKRAATEATHGPRRGCCTPSSRPSWPVPAKPRNCRAARGRRPAG